MTDNNQFNYDYTVQNQDEDKNIQNNIQYPTSNNIPQENNYPTEEEIKPAIYYPPSSTNEPPLEESAAPILPSQSQITAENLPEAYNQVYIPPPQRVNNQFYRTRKIIIIIFVAIIMIAVFAITFTH